MLDERPRAVVGVLPARAWVTKRDAFFVPAVLTPGRLAPSDHRTGQRSSAGWRPGPPWRGLRRAQERQRATDLGVSRLQAEVERRRATRGGGDPRTHTRAGAHFVHGGCRGLAHRVCQRCQPAHRTRVSPEQELALRAAIGATGNRLLRQVLTENLVLAAIGGLAGVGVAYLGVEVLRGVAAGSTPLSLAPRLDDRALFFTLVATLATGLVQECCRRCAPATEPARLGRRRRSWRNKRGPATHTDRARDRGGGAHCDPADIGRVVVAEPGQCILLGSWLRS